MKEVLISQKPEWCELTLLGKKTIEIRKSRPAVQTPFKVRIYCTYGDMKTNYCLQRRGYVVGEFICDSIDYISVYQDTVYAVDHFQRNILAQSCLTIEQLKAYIGAKNRAYAWHISELKIYDKPKELSGFITPTDCESIIAKDMLCTTCCLCVDFCSKKPKRITRPPQSWCYVQENMRATVC